MDIAKLIDFTNLKSETTEKEMNDFCDAAKKYNFRSVCIHPFWIRFCREKLNGTDILIAAVNDFPLGQGGKESKVFQAGFSKKMGANEIDTVINAGELKSGNYNLVLEELKSVCKILPTKVIIESGLLNDDEIKRIAGIVKKAGAVFIKTSTGYISNTEPKIKAEHIKLIKNSFPDLKIKASGGIKTFEDIKILKDAGADIFGISSSSAINIVESI